MQERDVNAIVSSTQEYYDGPADEIYRLIWRDNLHLGLPCSEDCPHPEAMEHTNATMAAEVQLAPTTQVLDLGCGYGSTARYLAAEYGCRVTGVNISRKELAVARQRAAEAQLSSLLQFDYGDFHALKYADQSFDVVWSQEAFLHGADKLRILGECRRVLKAEGRLVFTDITVAGDTASEDRVRIYSRIKSPDMWDAGDYLDALGQLNFDIKRVADWSEHVARSYEWVRTQLQAHRESLGARIDAETIAGTLDSLQFWVDAARAGKIGWSLFVAEKPS